MRPIGATSPSIEYGIGRQQALEIGNVVVATDFPVYAHCLLPIELWLSASGREQALP